jgi:AcrR family transcriptional regulator
MEYRSERRADRPMIYQTEETREKIVASALRLFTVRGFADTQMKDIAGAVGMSRTSLYRYYRDKLELAIVIVERMMARIFEDLDGKREDSTSGALPALALIESSIRRRWLSPRFRKEYAFMAEFDAAYSGRGIPPEFRQRLRKALPAYCDMELLKNIREGVKNGSVRGDIDPHLAMVTILNSVRGLQQRLLLRGKALIEVKRAELERMQEEHLRYLMAGLKPDL